MRSLWRIGSTAVAIAILSFGVSEAVQASTIFREPDCPEFGNWCAELRGGDTNCDQCCGNPASICTTTLEDDQLPLPYVQGCVCA
jgi:hypothetical protein